MSETNQKRSLLSRVGRWTAELVLVFVGVYASLLAEQLSAASAGCGTARPNPGFDRADN